MDDRNIHRVVTILRREVKAWEIPVVGRYNETPFTVLVACVLSLRTQDKTTDQASARLFRLASTPQTMVKLPVKTIERAIYPVGFYKTKARNILKICRRLLDYYGGKVPQEIDELLTLPGVGRKTANLVRTVGYGLDGICVDTHVHRISNRLGYVRTKTPEQTEQALRAKLPRQYWIEWNDLLVAYGQHRCTPLAPWCSQCKIARYCARVGVTRTR
ncbi:MAG: endonuclease III [Elusimicrobia bacterium]|nr:endonuclease III [Elusimicrobiota bacterium]